MPEDWVGVGGTYYFTVKAGDASGDAFFNVLVDSKWDE